MRQRPIDGTKERILKKTYSKDKSKTRQWRVLLFCVLEPAGA